VLRPILPSSVLWVTGHGSITKVAATKLETGRSGAGMPHATDLNRV
jgi:hypothetical protein